MKRRLPTKVTPATLLFLLGLLVWYVIVSPDRQLQKITNTIPTPTLRLPSPTVSPFTTPIPAYIVDQPAEITSDHAVVSRIIDGDTIEISTGQKVRYIGVDTPELHKTGNKTTCFGQQSRDLNAQLTEGKTIRMVKDVSETDRYGRLLRYIYVPGPDGTELFVNEYLVKEGYAYAVTFPPDVKYTEYFRQLQKIAEENKKGLWGNCEQ